MIRDTDSSIQSMVERWNSVWEPFAFERTAIPGADLRKLINKSTPIEEYQSLFDQYTPQIMQLNQFTPSALSSLRAREGGDQWLSDVYYGWADKTYSPLNYYYGVVNSKFYLPDTYLIPAGGFSGVDQLSQGFPEGWAERDAIVYAVNQFGSGAGSSQLPQAQVFYDHPVPGVLGADISLFKYHAGSPSEIFDDSTKSFRPYSEWINQDERVKGVSAPIVVAYFDSADASFGIILSPDEAREAIVNSGLFKQKTEYIVIGDEPQGGRGVVDLKSMIKIDDYQSLVQYLTLMPRSMLREFYMKKIFPTLPYDINNPASMNFANWPQISDPLYGGSYPVKQFDDMVWAAFIEVFNEANLNYINQNGLDPWTWEQKKTDAYYVSTSKEAIEQLSQEIDQFRDVSLALDPKAKSIMEDYLTLPKLGDVGFEVNRQNALKELLKMKDYVSAQAIVDAFRYANDSVLGEQLSKPIPYDVTTQDGSTMVRAT